MPAILTKIKGESPLAKEFEIPTGGSIRVDVLSDTDAEEFARIARSAQASADGEHRKFMWLIPNFVFRVVDFTAPDLEPGQIRVMTASRVMPEGIRSVTVVRKCPRSKVTEAPSEEQPPQNGETSDDTSNSTDTDTDTSTSTDDNGATATQAEQKPSSSKPTGFSFG